MPIFLTLRDGEGTALVTAMLPPAGKDERAFRPIIVGASNSDPYPQHGRGDPQARRALPHDPRSGALLPLSAQVTE